MDPDIKQAAQTTLHTCLGLTPGQTLLIVSDDDSPSDVVTSLYHQAQQMKLEVIHLNFTPREFNGQELPRVIAQALLHVDAYLGPTSVSFSHTDARRNASKAGVRGATLPGVTTDMFRRLMRADYNQIQQEAQKLLSQINQAKFCHITAPNGTDITVELSHDFEPDDGILTTPGSFGNLPAGEVMGAPSNSNGIIVFDTMGDIIIEPTWLEVANNKVISVQDNPSGTKLKALLDKACAQDGNQNAYHIAELGIGLNPLAKISGNVLEDEKVLGTCHIALGDNTSYPGGTNQASIHMDGIIRGFKVIFQ